jgi:long-chain fatty acid transport protein
VTGKLLTRTLLALAVVLAWGGRGAAQSYGIELYNNLQPASGGLAGVSLARPQDAPSALFGNPATMAQFQGTTFTFGGAWAEPTVTAAHDGAVTRFFGGGPFAGKSQTEGSLLGSFAVLQDLEAFGLRGVVGAGLNPGSGLGVDYRHLPGSAGLTAELLALDVTSGAAIRLTDRLSVGANSVVTFGLADVGLVQTSGAVHDYAIGGTFGAAYDLPLQTTVGANYRTQMNYTFDSLFQLPTGQFRDFNLDRPANVGLGIANRSLLGGDLLLAFDVQHIFWEDADLWKTIYVNQWTYAVGTQWSVGDWRLRAGYSYNTNPIRGDVGVEVNGFTVGRNAIELLQATQAPAFAKHRISGGFGLRDLLPGIDVDLYAGGMFRAEEQFGPHTSASIRSWFAGFGLTWRFGATPAKAEPCPACPADAAVVN